MRVCRGQFPSTTSPSAVSASTGRVDEGATKRFISFSLLFCIDRCEEHACEFVFGTILVSTVFVAQWCCRAWAILHGIWSGLRLLTQCRARELSGRAAVIFALWDDIECRIFQLRQEGDDGMMQVQCWRQCPPTPTYSPGCLVLFFPPRTLRRRRVELEEHRESAVIVRR